MTAMFKHISKDWEDPEEVRRRNEFRERYEMNQKSKKPKLKAMN